jgi:hypothetical protein
MATSGSYVPPALAQTLIQKGMGGNNGAPSVPLITGVGISQGTGPSQYTWTTVTEDTIGVRKTHTMQFSHWEIDSAVTLNYTGIMGSILGVAINRITPDVEFVIGCSVSVNQLIINRIDSISGSSPFFVTVFGV